MYMRKVRLIFGSTNSQPVGIDHDEIEQVYQRSYKPYLRALYNAPGIPVTLHYSGQLLQWLERHHSEYTDVLSEMVSRKQCELLGGGFYDPILSLIPRLDRLGQIESLTTYIRKRFGRRPRGTWITAHVWEPSLASTLKSSGMDYVFLDDYHFLSAGFTGDDLLRPCITEDQGKTVLVFPVCHELRRVARTGAPSAVIEYLREKSTDDESQVLVLLDHGERYEQLDSQNGGPAARNKWLGELVELLEANSDWIDVVLPSTVVKRPRSRARAYFYTASYQSIFEPDGKSTTIPSAASQGTLVPGGHFRQFLTTYPESNQMYAKMQYTHVLVNQIRGDKYRKQAAREELWRGQCHNAYWNGPHGEIYNNRLRKEVYFALIEAEKKTREKGIFIPSVIRVDFDMDGVDEYLYQGHDFNAYVHQRSGMLFELDYLPVCWNYLDTFSRRREGYHSADVAKWGYDNYPRKAFVDHFLPANTSLHDFSVGKFKDLGTFVSQEYSQVSVKRDSHLVTLEADGEIGDGANSATLKLAKIYRFRRNVVEVTYTFTAPDVAVRAIFAPEINLAFHSDDKEALVVSALGVDPKSREVSLAEPVDLGSIREMRLDDRRNRALFTLTLDRENELWAMPVCTARQEEGSLVRQYQSTALVPRFVIDLQPGDTFWTTVRLRVERS
jgi:alpha-amylase